MAVDRLEKIVVEDHKYLQREPESRWGEEFDKGITLNLQGGRMAHLFLDCRLHSQDPSEVQKVLSSDATIGYLISCEGNEWVVISEQTGAESFGIIVYTHSGKPYIAGAGTISSVGRWEVEFRTLYPGIRNSKCCHAQGGVRGGTGQKTEVQGGVGCDF